VGGDNQSGNKTYVPSIGKSGKDGAAHTKLKARQPGQGTEAELKTRDFRAELQERERKHFEKLGIASTAEPTGSGAAAIADTAGGGGGSAPLAIGGGALAFPEDADHVPESGGAGDGGRFAADSDSDSDSDSDEDSAALLQELEKIRRERAEVEQRKQQEETADEDARKQEAAMGGNPLLAGGGVRRRWDDDVVFKNQSSNEPAHKKRFINDAIRNDFHRRFLKRYIP